MDIKKYKKLYERVSRIIHEIDPGNYGGPIDEYDYQTNQIIKLMESNNHQDYTKISSLFFENAEKIADEQSEKISKIINKIGNMSV